ncbi:hypothetical protein [Bacillus cereus]|uniref:hypothetical protein n=1 Tax=Bacillus cereus TaxID=1396 RepID=UPI000BFA8948|nr:hypothetical protein [Bacillus cereus]PEV32704.1 hypothetical protein CN430_02045 [Bacillus cereus]PEY75270.1 hypothetical protein CN344_23755 [Bacillus cereus]PFA75859.1 hypothetical protein CN406_21670 [Bacillus cereus]PFC97701.1 hypothetical protein CN277_24090 [Bacillus cereus]PFI14594.1 hypothetical protein COI71_23220 [Bacillus cereus]
MQVGDYARLIDIDGLEDRTTIAQCYGKIGLITRIENCIVYLKVNMGLHYNKVSVHKNRLSKE